MLFQREYIGCYKDKGIRAMPKQLTSRTNLLEACTQEVITLGYTVFGIQLGHCFSGPTAQLTYDKYGNSTNCNNGFGGDWANDVYRIIPAGILNSLQTRPN